MESRSRPECQEGAARPVQPRRFETELLFELSPDVIVFLSFDGTIHRVNPAALKVSGYAEAEVIGADLRRFIHPEDLAAVEASIAQLARTGSSPPVEARGFFRNGAVAWYEWHAARLDDSTFVTIGRDITARRQAERTLALADAAMGQMAQGYWIHRPASPPTLYLSRELAVIFGFDADVGEVPLAEVLARIHPEDRERVLREMEYAEADPHCDQRVAQFRIQLPNGSVRTLATSARLVRDADGAFVESIGTAQDVTQQLAVETSLRHHLDLNAAIFDTTGAIVVVLDPAGNIVRVNGAVEQITGWRRDELLGTAPWAWLIPEDERDGVARMIEALRTGKAPVSHTNAWLTRSGRRVPIAWSNTVMRDACGEVKYIIATGIDISDLQQLTDELHLTRRAYRRLLELTFDMVLTCGADGTILDINAAGAQMLGAAQASEIVGLHLRDIVCPEHQAMAVDGVTKTLDGGLECRINMESQHLRRDGRRVDVEIIAAIATIWRGQPATQTLVRDITERKLARTTLEARESYFETLAQVAPVGIFQLDLRGTVVYANRLCTSMLGRPLVAGTPWDSCVQPEDRARARKLWSRAAKEQRPFVIEMRYVRPQGEAIWLRCKAIIDRNTRGELAGYIGTLTDITSFKVVTEQLIEAEMRARRLVDLSFDIIVLVERDPPTIVEINASGAVLLRARNAAELIGRPVTDLVRAPERPDLMHCINGALTRWSASAVRELSLLRCDGTVLDVEGAAIPVMYQGESMIYVVFRDLTARKTAQQALFMRERQLAALAKAAPVGIFQTDLHGQVTYANERYLAITGFALDEIAGQCWWEPIVPEDRTAFDHHWQQVQRHNGALDLEFRLRRKDGQIIWVHAQAVAEHDPAGEFLGYIGSVSDVNQAKLDEIELRNYREHLEEMVRERTVELEAVNRELESFSYSVSHDLRAPLRAISGFNGALVEAYGQQLDDDARFFLRRIQANTKQMGQLIEDLLELAKVTQAEICREWVDLSAAAAAIVEEFVTRDPVRQVEFAITPQLRAFGDPRLLRVVLQNLLENAWKYTCRNEGTARIEFGITEIDGERAFLVRDNGIGFDMSCASHLFRAFQRLHDTSRFEGTGIGLATVHRIILRHGGRIWAEAEEGRGATFLFRLPAP